MHRFKGVGTEWISSVDKQEESWIDIIEILISVLYPDTDAAFRCVSVGRSYIFLNVESIFYECFIEVKKCGYVLHTYVLHVVYDYSNVYFNSITCCYVFKIFISVINRKKDWVLMYPCKLSSPYVDWAFVVIFIVRNKNTFENSILIKIIHKISLFLSEIHKSLHQ